MKIDLPQIATGQTHSMKGLFREVRYGSSNHSFILTLSAHLDNERYFHFKDTALAHELMCLLSREGDTLEITFQGTDREDFDGELLSIDSAS